MRLFRLPKGPQDFVVFMLLQALNFLLIVINVRAIAHLQYAWAALTDGLVCLLMWTLFQKMSTARGWWARAGYVLGGVSGSLGGIWLTRVWGG